MTDNNLTSLPTDITSAQPASLPENFLNTHPQEQQNSINHHQNDSLSSPQPLISQKNPVLNPTSTPLSQKQIKETLSNDFSKIDTLVGLGKISFDIGNNLKLQLVHNALNSTKAPPPSSSSPLDNSPSTPLQTSQLSPLTNFEKENPLFFSASDSKKALKCFIQDNFSEISSAQLKNIASLVNKLEEQAIINFQASQNHSDMLNSNNKKAQYRLTSNNITNSPNDKPQRQFSRDEIKNMPVEEFKKLEKDIFSQYKKGLIK